MTRPPAGRRRLACFTVEELESRVAPSTLIPVTARRDLAFDDVRNLLYITTSDGKVQRYDATTGNLLPAWGTGTALNGADLTADAKFLYAAENKAGGTQGTVWKVDLATGSAAAVPYTLGFGEAGAWDVAALGNGKAFFTTRYNGSGWTPLRYIDTATDAVTTLTGVRQNSNLSRSADRSAMMLTEANISSGDFRLYSAAADKFTTTASAWFNDNMAGAVSRDGSLFSLQVSVTSINRAQSVFTAGLKAVENLSGIDGGAAFDPSRDVLYGVDSAKDQVIAFDAKTWRERYRLPVGEDVPAHQDFGSGVVAVSGDGKLLFLSTPAGVRRFDLPQPTGVAATLTFTTPFPAFLPAGATGTLTLTARDAFGDVAAGYTGTVRFSSSDAQAGLPADYTFTAADAGTRTFAVTLKTAATSSITAADAANGLSAAQAGIQVYAGAPSLLPIPARRDLIADDTRGQLLVPGSDGLVQRFDVATGTLLPPLRVSTGALSGGDVTPDGKHLYVADAVRGAVGGFFRKVDLTTGAVSLIPVPERAGTWDVAVLNNGKALADGTYEGSGSTPLYQIDLATDALTARFGVAAGSTQSTNLFRGADRSAVLVAQGNNSGGPMATYSAAADAFTHSATGWYNGNMAGAVSRDGSLFSLQVSVSSSRAQSVFDAKPRPVENLSGIDGGAAFDPSRDVLYGVDSAKDQVVAFDAKTWRERYRLPVGEDVPEYADFGTGVTAVTGDGKVLFLSTPAGVRRIALPQPTGIPAVLAITTPFPGFVAANTPGTLTVTVKDASGAVATGYTGTVTFTSTDPLAALPPSYTFTAADQGTHTFAVTLRSAGSRAVTVADGANGLTSTQSGIQVHDGTSNLVPVPTRVDLIWDETRNQLLITGSDGNLYRYDVATKTVLAPVPVGNLLEGGDITPDGKYLYVGDAVRGAAGGWFRKLDLTTGAVTGLPVAERAGTWAVTVMSNGTAMADGRYEGSGWVPVYQIDLATDALKARGSVRQDSYIVRTPGRGKAWFAESNISSGSFFWYDAGSDGFGGNGGINGFHFTSPGVDRTGTLFAAGHFGSGVEIYNAAGALTKTLLPGPGAWRYGLAFSPVADVLYVLDEVTGNLFAYDTTTWGVLFSTPLGEPIAIGSPFGFGPGEMALTGDGKTLFVATTSGVRFFDVSALGRKLAVTVSPASLPAGTGATVTVTAKDVNGFTLTGFTGTVHFASSDSQAGLPADYTFTAGDAGTHAFTVTLKTAGTQTVTVTDLSGTAAAGAGSATVTAGAAALFTAAGFPSPVTAGQAGALTVVAYDAFGNVATGYLGTVRFTSTDPQAGLPADYTFTAADAGRHVFTVTLKTAGSKAVTVADTANSGLTATQTGITVNPGPAATFALAGFPGSVTAGDAKGLTVTARDAFGNVATGYLGTVRFTSTDPQAGLAADYTFTAADAGSHAFTVTLKTAGTRAVTVTDTAAGSVTGQQTGIIVSPAAAATFALAGFPGTVTAGVAKSVTLTAVDPYGNVATGYLGTVHFTSTDPQAGLPADYTFAATDKGVRAFAVALKTAGTKAITATDTAAPALTGQQAGITVTPAAAAAFTLAGFPGSVTAGDAKGLTVTAVDPYGNVATGYLGTVHFTSTDPQAGLPADYTFTAADAGAHAFTVTLKTAGSKAITVTDTATGSITGQQTGITVSPAAATTFALAGFPAGITAGDAKSVTVTARDAFGNVATGYRGTVHFTSTDPQAGLPADYTFTAADAGSHAFTVTLKTAGTRAITAADAANGLTVSQTGIVVTPAAMAKLLVTGSPTDVTAGGTVGVTVTALDPFGNVAIGYLGTVHFTSTDLKAGLPADYTFAATDKGSRSFTATLKTAGTKAITIADVAAGVSGSQTGITVSPAAAATLTLTGLPASLTAGDSAGVVVTAVDQFGNVATGYLGTVRFTSTDPQAGLPADYTFTAADAGARAFTVTLKTAGTRAVTATDTAAGSITGLNTGITVNPGPAVALTLSGFPAAVIAGDAKGLTVTVRDAFGNTVAGYLGTVHFTSTDPRAGLPADYTFVAADNGVRAFAVTLKTAGSKTITATDTANPGLTAAHTGITVTPAAAAALIVAGFSSLVWAGTAGSVTVTALDPYGNVATGYRGTVDFTSTDPLATLPTDYTFGPADHGVQTFAGVVMRTAGTWAITARDTAGGPSGAQPGVVVTPAAAAALVVAGLPAAVTAGQSGTVTVSATDAYGNVATGFIGTVHFTSTDPQAGLPADYTFTAADKGTRAFGVVLKSVGVQGVATTSGGLSGSQSGVAVRPAAAAALRLTGVTEAVTAGAGVPVTVTAIDPFGNVATGYLGTVHFTSTDPQAGLPADYTLTAVDGGAKSFAVTFRTSGPRTLTAEAADGSLGSTDAVVVVAPAAAAQLRFVGVPDATTAGTPFTVTVVAEDAFGNPAAPTNPVVLAGADPRAVLPPAGPLPGGTAAFTLTLATAGPQTVTASSAGLTGAAAPVTVQPAAASRFVVAGYPNPAAAGATGTVTVTALDTFGNLAADYAGTVRLTSTDPRAALPPPAPLTAGGGRFAVTLQTPGMQAVTAVDPANPAVTGTQSGITVTSTTPPPAHGVREFAAGADRGSGSANFYDPDQSVRFSVDTLSGFTGGARTAAGDFNNDGVADLVVGTGPGGPSHVWVFSGTDRSQLFTIDPFEASFTGGVYVAAGDVNGDGIADLVIAPDEGGGPRCRVFSGSGFGQIIDFFGIADPDFRGGARPAVGDVNGDGLGDLVVAAGFLGGPRVSVWSGASFAGTPTNLFNDFFAFEQTLRNGVFIAAGDLDGDGLAEVIAGGGPGGGPRITAFSATDLIASGGGTLTQVANFFGGGPNNRGGVRVAVKDLDGDTKADLVVGSGAGAGSRVTGYLGKDIPAAGPPPEAFAFDAFPGFAGGVFVG